MSEPRGAPRSKGAGDILFCHHCGQSLPEDASFCPSCGTQRPSVATSTATASAARLATTKQVVTTAPALTVTPSPRTRARVDRSLAVTAARHALLVLGVALVGLTMIAAVASAVLGVGVGLSQLTRIAAFCLGSAFAGTVQLDGSVDFLVSVGAHVSLWAPPTTVTLILSAALAWLGARQERTRQSSTVPEFLGGASVSGAALTVGLLLLALVSRGSLIVNSPYLALMGSASIGLLSLLVGGLLIGTLSSLLGRVVARRSTEAVQDVRRYLSGRVNAPAGDLQTSVLFVVLVLALSLGTLVIVLLTHDDRLLSLAGLAGFIPTSAFAAASLFMGATWTASTNGDHLPSSAGDLNGSLGMVGASHDLTAYLLVVPLLAALVAGLLVGCRAPVTERRLASVCRTGISTAGAFLLLALVLRVVASFGGAHRYAVPVRSSIDVSMSWHGGLLSVALVAFVWGALARAAGVWLTIPFAQRLPRAATVSGSVASQLAGKPPLDADWGTKLAQLPQRGLGRRAVLVLGVLLAVLVGGAVLDKIVIARVLGPEAAVSSYFGKLSDGDARGVLAMQRGMASSGPLLTKDALRAQLREAPFHNVEVGKVSRDKDYATVQVTYEAGSTHQSGTLSLHQDPNDKVLGLWPRWKLTDTTAKLVVAVDGPVLRTTVDGVEVPATHEPIAVFPGQHALTAAPAQGFMASPSTVELAAPGDLATAKVTAYLGSSARDAIEAAAMKSLDDCIAQQVLAPKGCDFPQVYASETTGVRWRRIAKPDVAVGDSTGLSGLGDPDPAASAKISVDLSVNLDLRYQDNAYGQVQSEHQQVSLEMSGQVEWEGDEPTIVWEGGYDFD